MANAPQWDGKIYKRVKSGDRFDFRTVEGQERAAQIRERRSRFAEARRAQEMEAEMYRHMPWPFKVFATVVDYVFCRFEALARLRG
jgi:hypothetical protein